jgi:glycosyl transferase family 9 (putative heptosyltransferase)
MKQHASLLGRLTRPVLTPPFPEPMELDLSPVRGKPALSLLWRRLRPAASLLLHGQSRLQRANIDASVRRVLWIYKGSPQVGDSLMDLSSRVLLAERGIQIDLCTDPHLAALYAFDDIFDAALTDEEQIDATRYDLAMLDSLKWRCIEAKLGRLRTLPFITLRGCFSGPEFNRTLFSFFRMNQLLGAGLSAPALEAIARPYLSASRSEQDVAEQVIQSGAALAFAIGGASSGRTYGRWDEVVAALLNDMPQGQASYEIVLLGSANAIPMRDRIIAITRNYPSARIVDCVDRYSLPQTLAILQRCRLAVCADGGLLHLANAAQLSTVALFDRNIAPHLRLTAANRSIPLQASGAINDISPADVLRCMEQALTRWPTAH